MERKPMSLRLITAGASLILFGAAATAQGAETPLPTPGTMSATPQANGCTNATGPFITLNGELALEGVGARLIFRNNTKGTHEASEDVTVDIVLLDEGETIQFAKQPPLGGVGGNPFIFLEFLDGSMTPFSTPHFLGRCVQGLDSVVEDLDLSSVGEVSVTTGGCNNRGGPSITMSGALTLGGVNARLTFTNSDQFPPHITEEDVQVSFVILEPGEEIAFAKQPPQGGAGGNPLIYVQFTDADGQPISDELFLGRCSKLSA
jgi:hypothetical protein